MTLQELFVANLRDYRKLRNYSQLQLAEECGSSQTYIAELETGKKSPSLDMVERIAAALGIESWFLFRDEPSGKDEKRKLSHSEKKEITERIREAAARIIGGY
ncbi:MAG: helix-turn-helix domain-containing protein [Treponema sp.]|jgi:transcriptional regulator with XRE-family HTH domain|nr:helix-turn-helix domain-containing protein [Treponema sp.]